jgi:TRAP-type C4-dicarboxylate transport system substrate-binding protein
MERTLDAVLRALRLISRFLAAVARPFAKLVQFLFSKAIGSLGRNIALFVTLVTGIFVGLQYLDVRWKSRIERSLNLALSYQEESKVNARNETELLYSNMESFPNPADCDPYSADLAANIDQQGDSGICALNRCKVGIHKFVNDWIDEQKSGVWRGIWNARAGKLDRVYGDWPNKLFELGEGEGIETRWGSVAVLNGKFWWMNGGTTYAYTWPEMLFRFFHSNLPKYEKFDDYRSDCEDVISQFEDLMRQESETLIESLHTQRHFYATVSICATSGVCDSFVACEAFYRDVGNFVANWQNYLELWSAREASSGYDRLHGFFGHCSSNEEFGEYLLTARVSDMLSAQQFTNYCWDTEDSEGLMCRAMRWATETRSEPEAQETLTVHHFVPSEATAHASFIVPWAQAVEEQSEGQIAVEISPNMNLGGDPEDLYAQVRAGDVDIVWTLIGYTPGQFPRSEVFELPTVHRGSALATTLAIQDAFDQIEADYDDADVYPLLIHAHTGQVLHMVNEPIRSVDDLAGLKIRTPSHTGKMLIEDAWGAEPIEISVPRLRGALADSAIDGALLPYEIVTPYEIDDHVQQSIEGPDGRRFGTSVFAFIMNRDRYDDLPDDLKAVIDANSGDAIAGWVGALWDSAEEAGRDAAIASGLINDLDPEIMAEFDKRSQLATDAWLDFMRQQDITESEALLRAAVAAVDEHQPSK